MTDEVEWFRWREVQEALAYARTGAIALHYFHYDLRRFGLRIDSPCCHVLSADPDRLTAFVARFGLPPLLIKPPKPHRPDVWHFDAFGWVLDNLMFSYPPPFSIDGDGDRVTM
jgi:hypothetical protein